MAAPEYVPTSTTARKHYTSPPNRDGAWNPDRPGEVVGAYEPGGRALGSPGPDQGFVFHLIGLFDDEIHLAVGEHRSDVDAGCIAVALKRASVFGRAPIVHDLRIAYTLFGFLDASAPDDLVAQRKELFAEVHYSFHYFEQRAIADLVSAGVLRQSPQQVQSRYAANWRDQLGA